MSTIRKIDRFTDAVLSATDRLRPHAQHINAAAERQYIAAEQSELSAADRAEYNALLDADHAQYWADHCPQHACELPCAECEAELSDERRQEGFLDRHEGIR